MGVKKIILLPIYIYRYFISAIFPPCCRFVPSCSSYAIDVFKNHNFVKAFILTIVRIIKCNPFCKKSGFDPAPINFKKIVVRDAKLNDRANIFKLVNDAYKIEREHKDFAFKNVDRYLQEDEVMLDDYKLFFYNEKMVAAICLRIGAKYSKFGPLAVNVSYQGMGIGSFLINYAEEYLRNLGSGGN